LLCGVFSHQRKEKEWRGKKVLGGNARGLVGKKKENKERKTKKEHRNKNTEHKTPWEKRERKGEERAAQMVSLTFLSLWRYKGR